MEWTLLILLLLIPFVSAETTFFDQDDFFIVGESISLGGTGTHYETNETSPIEKPSFIESLAKSIWSSYPQGGLIILISLMIILIVLMIRYYNRRK